MNSKDRRKHMRKWKYSCFLKWSSYSEASRWCKSNLLKNSWMLHYGSFFFKNGEDATAFSLKFPKLF